MNNEGNYEKRKFNPWIGRRIDTRFFVISSTATLCTADEPRSIYAMRRCVWTRARDYDNRKQNRISFSVFPYSIAENNKEQFHLLTGQWTHNFRFLIWNWSGSTIRSILTHWPPKYWSISCTRCRKLTRRFEPFLRFALRAIFDFFFFFNQILFFLNCLIEFFWHFRIGFTINALAPQRFFFSSRLSLSARMKIALTHWIRVSRTRTPENDFFLLRMVTI